MSVYSQTHLKRVPQMATAMINFRKKVVELSRIFKWNCVLQVALEHHGIVCDGGVTNYTVAGSIPELLYPREHRPSRMDSRDLTPSTVAQTLERHRGSQHMVGCECVRCLSSSGLNSDGDIEY